jgi:hypothetical protein
MVECTPARQVAYLKSYTSQSFFMLFKEEQQLQAIEPKRTGVRSAQVRMCSQN